jgi:hypothetical protein
MMSSYESSRKPLTDSLNAGQHIIEVQFLREEGTVKIVDRILTVIELVIP